MMAVHLVAHLEHERAVWLAVVKAGKMADSKVAMMEAAILCIPHQNYPLNILFVFFACVFCVHV